MLPPDGGRACVQGRRGGGAGYTYEPTYLLRGVTALHLEYTPVLDASA